MHFICNWEDLGCVSYFKEQEVQVKVLKSCKSVQESSEEVLYFKARKIARQIAQQMYLLRFKMWNLIDKVDSCIYWELRKLVFQIWFHAYLYVCV